MLLLKRSLPGIFVWPEKFVARIKAARHKGGPIASKGAWLKPPLYRGTHVEWRQRSPNRGRRARCSQTDKLQCIYPWCLQHIPILNAFGDHSDLASFGSLKAKPLSRSNWEKSSLIRVMTQTDKHDSLRGDTILFSKAPMIDWI